MPTSSSQTGTRTATTLIMNEHKRPRSNKSKNDKDSILADAKNLLFILYPAIQRMPKIECLVAVVGMGQTAVVRSK